MSVIMANLHKRPDSANVNNFVGYYRELNYKPRAPKRVFLITWPQSTRMVNIVKFINIKLNTHSKF